MSKAVLLSIQPKWCELIAIGIKTIEVRKTRPKLETPFKCYIYQTKRTWVYNIYSAIADWQGKVIGEFECDTITYFGNISSDKWEYLIGNIHEYHKRVITEFACLTEKELLGYGGKYGWHISDLKIYDKPRNLKLFNAPCLSTANCENCRYSVNDDLPWCEISIGCDRRIQRPPQSWCYVEELMWCF